MQDLLKIWKNLKVLERIFLGLVFISTSSTYVFRYGGTIDIMVFGLALSVLYFPLGFYFFGKPTIPSIVFGFIYTLGIVICLMGTLKQDGYIEAFFVALLLLMIVTIFLLFKLSSKKYDQIYVYSQLFRIGFIIAMNLVIVLFNLSNNNKPSFFLSVTAIFEQNRVI